MLAHHLEMCDRRMWLASKWSSQFFLLNFADENSQRRKDWLVFQMVKHGLGVGVDRICDNFSWKQVAIRGQSAKLGPLEDSEHGKEFAPPWVIMLSEASADERYKEQFFRCANRSCVETVLLQPCEEFRPFEGWCVLFTFVLASRLKPPTGGWDPCC